MTNAFIYFAVFWHATFLLMLGTHRPQSKEHWTIYVLLSFFWPFTLPVFAGMLVEWMKSDREKLEKLIRDCKKKNDDDW